MVSVFDFWWRRLLVWVAMNANKSILDQILTKVTGSTDDQTEGLLYIFGYIMRRPSSLKETIIVGSVEGKRARGQLTKR